MAAARMCADESSRNHNPDKLVGWANPKIVILSEAKDLFHSDSQWDTARHSWRGLSRTHFLDSSSHLQRHRLAEIDDARRIGTNLSIHLHRLLLQFPHSVSSGVSKPDSRKKLI